MAFLEYFRDDKSEHNDEWKTVYWKNVLFILKMFSLGWGVASCDKSLLCSTYLLARQAHVVIAALTRHSPFLLLSKFKGGKIRLESNSIKFQSWGKFHPNEIWNYDLCSDWIGSDRIEFKNLIISKYR